MLKCRNVLGKRKKSIQATNIKSKDMQQLSDKQNGVREDKDDGWHEC